KTKRKAKRRTKRRAKQKPKRRARAPARRSPSNGLMGKVRELKRRADSVLEEVFRSLFEEIDMDKVRKEVVAVQAGAPEMQRIEHARQLARRTAIRCAAAGAVTGLPS